MLLIDLVAGPVPFAGQYGTRRHRSGRYYRYYFLTKTLVTFLFFPLIEFCGYFSFRLEEAVLTTTACNVRVLDDASAWLSATRQNA
jgi:hypothetical protein